MSTEHSQTNNHSPIPSEFHCVIEKGVYSSLNIHLGVHGLLSGRDSQEMADLEQNQFLK